MIAPNYQAGKDMMAAFQRDLRRRPAARSWPRTIPKLGETDYAPYLTKIKQSGAKAVFAFFSGTDAVNFVKQYDQFGLKQTIKLTGAGFLTEPDVLPAQGQSALGIITGHFYSPLLDNPTNQKLRQGLPGTVSAARCPTASPARATTPPRSSSARSGRSTATRQDKDKLGGRASPRSSSTARAGRFRFDPKTHNVIQPFIYIREGGGDGAGGLNNVPIDKVADVTRSRHRLHAAGVTASRGRSVRARLLAAPRSWPSSLTSSARR